MVPLSLLEIIGNEDRNKTETIVEGSFYLGDEIFFFCIKRVMKKSWALENKPQINSRRPEILFYLFFFFFNSLETCTVPRNSIHFFFFVCVINKGENGSWAPMSSSMNLFNMLV